MAKKKKEQEQSKKSYVLDTNVLLVDPMSIFKFGDNDVYIPLPVLEELDNFKKGLTEKAFAAREVNRKIDELREDAKSDGTNLSKGVKMYTGGTLRVLSDPPVSKVPALAEGKVDNIVIQMALDLKKSNGSAILVSKDCNMRVKADAVGLDSEDYKNSIVQDYNIYDKIETVIIDEDIVAALHQDQTLTLDGLLGDIDPYVNQYVFLKSHEDDQETVVRVVWNEEEKEREVNVVYPSYTSKYPNAFGLKPINAEQRCALDALLDDSVHCVSLVGKAGTGKSLLALAAALQLVVEEKKYSKIIISRPAIHMGKELGFLPGDLREKMDPWLAPIYDNFNVLFDKKAHKDMRGKNGIKHLEETGLIEIQAVSMIRGRSLNDCILICDEMQNTSAHEIKTVLTRAGKNTKVIITGDPYQIDAPYLDSQSNGVSHLINALKGDPLYANIILTQGERSALSDLASDKL